MLNRSMPGLYCPVRTVNTQITSRNYWHGYLLEVPYSFGPNFLVQLRIYSDVFCVHMFPCKPSDGGDSSGSSLLETPVKGNKLKPEYITEERKHQENTLHTTYTPCIYLCKWTVYSLVTTSLRADFLSFFGGIV